MDFDNLSNDDDFHSSFSTGSKKYATLGSLKPQQANFQAMDADVLSLISSLSATQASPTQLGSSARPYNSSYPASEAESDGGLSNPFSGLNKDSLSVISAPYLSRGPIKHNLFGSLSIAGHVITQLSPFEQRLPLRGSNFLDKFGSVADRTRELESGLAGFHLGDELVSPVMERRGSLLAERATERATLATDLATEAQHPAQPQLSASSPHSLHEPLNTTSRHQSVSDRIDSYQQEQERRLSFSSEVLGSDNASASGVDPQPVKHNIWNPASAHTFRPSALLLPFYGGQAPLFAPSMYPAWQEPVLVAGQAPALIPALFVGENGKPAPLAPQNGGLAAPNGSVSSPNGTPASQNVGPAQSKPPVNLLNRSMSPPAFMVPPFIPFGMFSPMPFPQGGEAGLLYKTPMSPSQSPAEVKGGKRGPGAGAGAGAAGSNVNPNVGNVGSGNGSGNGSSSGNSSGPGNGRHRSRNTPFVQRSPLLEEFRANTTNRQYRLSDIYGHGIEFSKDQHGSRFIQAQLSESSDEEKEVIFNEIREFAYDLMSDVFGNYVIQKYFEHGNTVQRAVLLETMTSHIRELSLQMYGCRVVQRAIEHIGEEQKRQLVLELRDARTVVECCKDANGNHVIQKLLELVPVADIEFIFELIKEQIYHLSTNSFGCRVVQKLLEFGQEQQCRYIISVLEKYVDVLLVDKFGNYVIQCILTGESNCDTSGIVQIINDTIMTDFTKLSQNKFSSNVVESFIVATPFQNRCQIKKLVMEDKNSRLVQLINDPYGNYVVQKLVSVDKGKTDDVSRRFLVLIREYLENTENTNSKLSIEKLRLIVRSI